VSPMNISAKARRLLACSVPANLHHVTAPLNGRKGGGVKGKGSPYSITERRVPELIPGLGIHPAGDVNHKPDGRLPLLSARPVVIPPQPLRGLLPVFAAW